MRLIDADALIPVTLTDGGYWEKEVYYKSDIDNAPTIWQIHNGTWLGEGDGYANGAMVYDVWKCDQCGYIIDDGTDDPERLPNYCPNCGANMKGELK